MRLCATEGAGAGGAVGAGVFGWLEGALLAYCGGGGRHAGELQATARLCLCTRFVEAMKKLGREGEKVVRGKGRRKEVGNFKISQGPLRCGGTKVPNSEAQPSRPSSHTSTLVSPLNAAH